MAPEGLRKLFCFFQENRRFENLTSFFWQNVVKMFDFFVLKVIEALLVGKKNMKKAFTLLLLRLMPWQQTESVTFRILTGRWHVDGIPRDMSPVHNSLPLLFSSAYASVPGPTALKNQMMKCNPLGHRHVRHVLS